ncbi:MAG: cytochrome d ubiquinol oxidase subunit II [Kofleriaceae bacterium]|nr:cytochrome d ubiquinol oxidase subunit II [Kofleriaceae bacterium]
MATTWFILLAFMLTMYVVLDGFDLGAGILHLFVTKHDDERRTVLASIGPVWDGNEVWLVASGGLLVFAFPRVYAVAFSGFYLPLMLVLWLLVLRGVAIELRSHHESVLWQHAFDVVFAFSSAVLAFVLGVALGNVLRGVPIDATGFFSAPLFTDFDLRGDLGALDWYTISIGLFAVAALAAHGAMYLRWKATGDLNARATHVAWWCWSAVVGLLVVITIETALVQPTLLAHLASRPALWIAPIATILAFVGVFLSLTRSGRTDDELATHSWERRGFVASALVIASLLVLTAGALWPLVLPSRTAPNYSLDVHNAANDDRGLVIGLVWWIPAIALAITYFVYLFRSFRGKVSPTSAYGSDH